MIGRIASFVPPAVFGRLVGRLRSPRSFARQALRRGADRANGLPGAVVRRRLSARRRLRAARREAERKFGERAVLNPWPRRGALRRIATADVGVARTCSAVPGAVAAPGSTRRTAPGSCG